MKSNIDHTILNAKDLLKKLLKEHLDNNICNLEIKNQNEIKELSIIKDSSNEIINYLSQLTSNSEQNHEIQEKKHILIPKLKIDIINNNHHEKIQSNREGESFVINSILKKKRNSNALNKEKLVTSINLDKNKNTNTTRNSRLRVSFVDKSSMNKTQINETPERAKENKTYINNTTIKNSKRYEQRTLTDNNIILDGKNYYKKKKNDNFAKSTKSLTERNEKNNKNERINTPLTMKGKKKNINNKNDGEINTNNNNNETKYKLIKKGNKTTYNFHSKTSKSLAGLYVNEFNLEENNNREKRIIKDEKKLNSVCDSLLNDVSKDELLVNNSKIIFNDTLENDFGLRKISLSDSEDLEENSKNIFHEKFEASIQYILPFLAIQDILNLYLTKKEILKIILNFQINDTKKSIEEINSFLNLKNINNIKDTSILKELEPFELNQNSLKAITLLDSISKTNFIKTIMNYNNKDNINKNNIIDIRNIILIFDLYFITLGKKKIINNFNENNNLKIEYICNYFNNNKINSIGEIIQNDLKDIKFNDYIINSLYEYSYKYINIINPNYYKKINKDIAILVFLIKNILDYVGISQIGNKNNKLYEQKFIIINQSRLNIKNILLNKYNQILHKFN